MDAEERIVSALINAIRKLPDDVETLILEAAESERSQGPASALPGYGDVLVPRLNRARLKGLHRNAGGAHHLSMHEGG